MIVHLTKHFTFEASHILPKHPGKCSRLHGHSWKLAVTIKGVVDPDTGFVTDFGDLKALITHKIISNLDHSHLGCGTMFDRNNISSIAFNGHFGETFYPTSENLSAAIGRILQPLIKELPNGPELHSITIDETCTSSATWYARDNTPSPR